MANSDADRLGSASALLFDFDGTLVDTMRLHYEAYRRVFERLGLQLSWRQFSEAVGGSAAQTIPRLLAGRSCSASVSEIHGQKKRELGDLLEDCEIPVLETAKILEFFRGKLPLGLVSSGSRPGIETMLRRLGWTNWFDAIVTGEHTSSGKPAPEPFLLAARRLGVDPSRCLVFEDTDDGVAAARAAGMAVFDIRRACPAERIDERTGQ